MTAIRITPRPGLFSITDYQNTTIGDDATGLRLAFAAAVTAGGGVIQLENKAGGYHLKSSGDVLHCVLTNGDNRGTPITIQGRGKEVTKLYYHSPISCLVGINPQNSYPIYSPINILDLSIDGTSNAINQLRGIIYNYTTSASQGISWATTGRHHVERVAVHNFAHGNVSPYQRHAIRWNANVYSVADAYSRPTTKLYGLVVRDCEFGTELGNSTQRGCGAAAVSVAGFIAGRTDLPYDKDLNGRFTPNSLWTNQVANPANVEAGDIWIQNIHHSSGASPISVNMAGDPILLGGDGVCTHCRISGGEYRNSGDVGIEIDGGFDCVIEGARFYNGDGNQILIMPFGTGFDNDETTHVIRDCHVVYEETDSLYGVDEPTQGIGTGAFVSGGRFGTVNNGSILWENCSVHVDNEEDKGTTMFQLGPARRQIVRDCRVVYTGTRTTASSAAMQINAVGRSQQIVVENFQVTRNNRDVSISMTDEWLRIQAATDLHLQVKGLTGSSAGTESGSGKRAIRAFSMPFAASNPTETFSKVTTTNDGDLLTYDFFFDAGTASDYTYVEADSNYTATTDLSTEKRAVFIATNTTTSPQDGEVGYAKDGAHHTKMKTGASRTGYKGGAFGKRKDASNYLEAYVYDNGTNTYLCLDKVLAGVRTSLLPAAGGTATGAVDGGNLTTDAITPTTGVSDTGLIVTRLGTSSTHYPSIVVVGDTITAEHWVSAEPGNSDTRPVGTGDAWCSATLLTTDIYVYGSRTTGTFGFSQIPIDAAATIGKTVHRRRGVLSGKLEDLYIGGVAAAKGNCSAFYYTPTFATKARIDGQFEVVGCDFRNLKGSTGTTKDFDMIASSTAFTQKLRMRNNQLIVPATDTAVTFVSGTAWQNQTGCWGSLTIQAGTVTKVELSKDGTNYRDTGVIAGSIRVAPEWYVKLTHTGAPTSYFIVED